MSKGFRAATTEHIGRSFPPWRGYTFVRAAGLMALQTLLDTSTQKYALWESRKMQQPPLVPRVHTLGKHDA
jgi:hypothetical protein